MVKADDEVNEAHEVDVIWFRKKRTILRRDGEGGFENRVSYVCMYVCMYVLEVRFR